MPSQEVVIQVEVSSQQEKTVPNCLIKLESVCQSKEVSKKPAEEEAKGILIDEFKLQEETSIHDSPKILKPAIPSDDVVIQTKVSSQHRRHPKRGFVHLIEPKSKQTIKKHV